MQALPFPSDRKVSYLIDSSSSLGTIASEHGVAGHASNSILIHSPTTPSRVGAEHTRGHIASVVVLKQAATAAPYSVVCEGAVVD